MGEPQGSWGLWDTRCVGRQAMRAGRPGCSDPRKPGARSEAGAAGWAQPRSPSLCLCKNKRPGAPGLPASCPPAAGRSSELGRAAAAPPHAPRGQAGTWGSPHLEIRLRPGGAPRASGRPPGGAAPSLHGGLGAARRGPGQAPRGTPHPRLAVDSELSAGRPSLAAGASSGAVQATGTNLLLAQGEDLGRPEDPHVHAHHL